MPHTDQTPPPGTRERILEKAAALFCDQGYAHGSMRSIAASTGIRGASIYHHFRSKEEMAAAVLAEGARIAIAEIEAIDVEGLSADPAALFDAAVAAHVRAYQHPSRALAALVQIYSHLPPDLFAFTRRALHPYLERWVEVIERIAGRPTRPNDLAEAQAASLILFGAINAMVDLQETPGLCACARGVAPNVPRDHASWPAAACGNRSPAIDGVLAKAHVRSHDERSLVRS